jgi:hypothetical protein
VLNPAAKFNETHPVVLEIKHLYMWTDICVLYAVYARNVK